MSLNDDQEERIRAALAMDHHSRSAYTGRISQTETVIVHDQNGVPIQKDVSIFISWDTIEQILNMVRSRANL